VQRLHLQDQDDRLNERLQEASAPTVMNSSSSAGGAPSDRNASNVEQFHGVASLHISSGGSLLTGGENGST
jgi:hypothetical protein